MCRHRRISRIQEFRLVFHGLSERAIGANCIHIASNSIHYQNLKSKG